MLRRFIIGTGYGMVVAAMWRVYAPLAIVGLGVLLIAFGAALPAAGAKK